MPSLILFYFVLFREEPKTKYWIDIYCLLEHKL